jgi:HSP20 family protein
MAKQDVKGNEPQTQSGQELSQQSGAGRGEYPAWPLLSSSEFFRRGPFSLWRRMNEEMDRMFGELAPGRGAEARGGFTPAIEVRENDGKYEIRAELPGVNPDDVRLEITDDAVVIDGERRAERKEERGGVHIMERRYGRFYRAIPLPEGAKTGDATARFNNGVLEVDVPIERRQTKSRQIPIQSAQSPQGEQQSKPPAGSSNKAA